MSDLWEKLVEFFQSSEVWESVVEFFRTGKEFEIPIGFTLLAYFTFGMTGALGILLCIASRQAHREQRFPPSGRWSWSSTRVVTGQRARVLARTGIVLALALVALSIAGGTLTWYLASVLLACRAT